MTTRHVSTHVTNTSAELNTNVEKKTLTTAHQLGRNGNSNNRDSKNRECNVNDFLDRYYVVISPFREVYRKCPTPKIQLPQHTVDVFTDHIP